ncbi:hypothetical protein B4140_2932 [Bacillus amyloliquefaciens]|nr:hypothetical protein B4140_2932 [Bacillus amyloliquefaciens]
MKPYFCFPYELFSKKTNSLTQKNIEIRLFIKFYLYMKIQH